MGDIKRPSEDWDKREREFDRRKRPIKRPRRPERRIEAKCYLGFGHCIYHWSDGAKELVREGTPISRVFYGAKEYTDDGFPVQE